MRTNWVLAAVFALTVASPAFGIDETTRVMLRQLSSEGVAAYQEGDYPVAVDKLERAWAILPTAPLGLWSARALEKSGRWLEASERYLAAKRAPLDTGGDRAAQEDARKEAAAAYEAIQPRIPTVTVHIEGAEPEEVTVTVAGREILADLIGLPVPVDPGKVEIEVSAPGREASKTVRIDASERKEVTLTLTPGSSAASPAPVAVVPAAATAGAAGSSDSGSTGRGWQPVAGWIGVGLGGAGLVLGGVTGGILLGKWSELGCGGPSGMCNADATETQSLNNLRTVSTIGFIAGGVLAAAGVTLLITAPRKKEVALRPYVTFDSVGVVGTF